MERVGEAEQQRVTLGPARVIGGRRPRCGDLGRAEPDPRREEDRVHAQLVLGAAARRGAEDQQLAGRERPVREQVPALGVDADELAAILLALDAWAKRRARRSA